MLESQNAPLNDNYVACAMCTEQATFSFSRKQILNPEIHSLSKYVKLRDRQHCYIMLTSYILNVDGGTSSFIMK